MITFLQLLSSYGIDPKQVRLIRHSNSQINVLDAFHNNLDRLTQYSSFQRENKFGKSEMLAMFVSARGTTALFLGFWDVDGVTLNHNLTEKHQSILKDNKLPEVWFEDSVYYHLKPNDLINDLSERLVIEWGKSTVSWVQLQDKDIIQIKPKNSIGDFVSYDDIQLSYSDLKKLVKDADSNVSWANALSSVNGIYLIQHKIDGSLYVGSAYGKQGILGRWSTYATTGNGGNKKLKGLNPDNFEFSILEIASSIISADELIERESRWKTRLGTRKFGLNDN